MKTTLAIRALFLVACLAASVPASAQPFAWIPQNFPSSGGAQPPSQLRTLNVGTGVPVAGLVAPPGVTIGRGMVSANGQFYYVASSLGIARFRTATRQLEGLIGPAQPFSAVYVSPSGLYLHAVGDSGYTILSAANGAVLRNFPERRPLLGFTANGARVELYTTQVGSQLQSNVTLSADTPDALPVWQRSLVGSSDQLAVNNQYIALSLSNLTEQAAVVLDLASGNELGRRTGSAVFGLALTTDRLVVSTTGTPVGGVAPASVAIHSLPTLLEERTVTTTSDSRPGRAFTSTDGTLTYVLRLVLATATSVVDTIDLNTGGIVGSVAIGSPEVADFALEPGSPCAFTVPPSVAVPGTGGVVQIPVTTSAACGPWTVPASSVPGARVLNPGPHVGSTVISILVDPNASAATQTFPLSIGGRVVLLTQPVALPSAPEVSSEVVGNRIRITWSPTPGGGITAFVLRGGFRGQPLAPIASFMPDERTFLSPVLGPGEYAVEMVARNAAGDSPASPQVFSSVGIVAPPQAPVNLQADVDDDVVALTWAPSSVSPVASGYIIEAAPAGSLAFGEVARSGPPSYILSAVPLGSWQVRVRGTTDGGAGPPSNVITFTIRPCTAPPSAPSGLSANATAGVAALRWFPPAIGGARDFVIEAGSAPGLSNLAVVGTGSPQTIFRTGAPAGAYYLRVRARNACGTSAPSNEVLLLVQ